MNIERINLEDEVRSAVLREWSAFEASHPKLAAVLSEDLVIAGAVEVISEDPDYKSAMQAATTAGDVAGAITDLIHRLVGRWMKTLI